MGLQGVIILQFYYVCTLKQERKFKIFEDGAKVKKKSETAAAVDKKDKYNKRRKKFYNNDTFKVIMRLGSLEI